MVKRLNMQKEISAISDNRSLVMLVESKKMAKEILQTRRLTLEELTEAHFDDLYQLLSNKNVHRYFPRTLNIDESREFLAKIRKKYIEDGTSFWAVIRKGDRRFIGICGLLKQTIDGKDELEVGYRINDKYWGRGYGTEAAAGCMEYAKEVLKSKSVISLIREVNHPSIRVARKNGLIYEGDTLFMGFRHGIYRKRFGSEQK